MTKLITDLGNWFISSGTATVLFIFAWKYLKPVLEAKKLHAKTLQEKELLDVLSRTNKMITVYTKNMDNTLIKKYQSQYNNLTIKINSSFHDRFIIIDDKILYHSGASFKYLGKKCFAINKIDNMEMIKDIKNKLVEC